jgi:hypothetical protein
MIDDRFTPQDFKIAAAKDINEFLKLYQNRSDKHSGFIANNMLINKLYALRHGYQLYLSDMSEFKEFQIQYPNRHPVWLKPNFVLSVMTKDPSCEWISFMDTDAHFWMDRHQTSLDLFFSTASLMEGSHPYEEIEYQKRKRNGYFPWKEQDLYFIIGMNGMYENGHGVGWPFPIHSTHLDVGCAGVFFVKNNDQGRLMMHQWIYGPENASQEIRDQYEHFAQEWAREQSVLNRIIMPMHSKYIGYYSYRDFVDPDGSAIRHIWTVWKGGRDLFSSKVLHILLPSSNVK